MSSKISRLWSLDTILPSSTISQGDTGLDHIHTECSGDLLVTVYGLFLAVVVVCKYQVVPLPDGCHAGLTAEQPGPDLRMDHIFELVLGQIPDLLPGIAQRLGKTVADKDEITVRRIGAAVVSHGNGIIQTLKALVLLFQRFMSCHRFSSCPMISVMSMQKLRIASHPSSARTTPPLSSTQKRLPFPIQVPYLPGIEQVYFVTKYDKII